MSIDAKSPHARPPLASRRPLSIFSRRGSFNNFDLTSIVEAHIAPVASPTERHRRWIQARSRLLKCRADTKRTSRPKSPLSPQRGTILKAVPPAQLGHMSTSEIESAVSPSEESWSSRGKSNLMSRSSFSHAASKTLDGLNHARLSSPPSKTSANRTDDAKIGLWQNGSFHWDNGELKDRLASSHRALAQRIAVAPVKSSNSTPSLTKLARPRLIVATPSSQSLMADSAFDPKFQHLPQETLPVHGPPYSAPILEFGNVSRPVLQRGLTSPCVLYSEPLRVESVPSSPSRDDGSSSRNSFGSSPRSSCSKSDKRSRHSSSSTNTSIDVDTSSALAVKTLLVPDLTLSQNFPNEITPRRTGVFHSDINKPLPPTPNVNPPVRSDHDSAPLRRLTFAGKDHRLRRWIEDGRCDSGMTADLDPRASLKAMSALFERLDTSPSHHNAQYLEVVSPTLSRAEHELEDQLSALGQHVATIEPKSDVDTMQQSPRTPTVPKRSRKREWQSHRKPHHNNDEASSRLRKRVSESALPDKFQVSHDTPVSRHEHRKSISPRLSPQRSPAQPQGIVQTLFDDGLIVVDGPVVLRRTSYSDYMAQFGNYAPETVLFKILSKLPTIRDLSNTAVINKGMYRVYRQNEQQLVRQVAFNESPAAWEYCQWSLRRQAEGKQTCSTQENHATGQSMAAYLEIRRQDSTILDSLKKLIVEKCTTFMRKETSAALSDPASTNAQRFDDALWRIWTFCKIFGGDSGLEDDLTGQLDWLKGGPIAGSDEYGATVNNSFAFDSASVLLNPPEFFGKGNGDGLSSDELYDMIELWTCMASLLQDYHGYVEEAREEGVYDRCGPINGSQDLEENMLEEWILYLLTLGPSVVLDMAEFEGHYISEGFNFANANEWTSWSPPEHASSRNIFLREPLSRLYQQRISTVTQRPESIEDEMRKESDRKRIAILAAEIKLSRQSSDSQHHPMIDMKRESRINNNSVRNSIQSISTSSTRRPARYSVNMSLPQDTHPRYAQSTRHRSVRSTSNIGTVPESKSPTSLEHSSLQYFRGVADDASDNAVRAVVEMGFTPGEARHALRLTDIGDGRRVERAVDFLLRRQHSNARAD